MEKFRSNRIGHKKNYRSFVHHYFYIRNEISIVESIHFPSAATAATEHYCFYIQFQYLYTYTTCII